MESKRSRYGKYYFQKNNGCNRWFGTRNKAVDTAIEIAKLSEAKLYAVHVIELGEFLVTQHNPGDPEWKTSMKEQLIKEGKEATTYVENAGRAANVKVES